MPVAWLVVAESGFRAVFIDQTQAINYAARCRGAIYPLVIYASQPDP